MLPANAISAVTEFAPYLAPDASDVDLAESLEEGGAAINDATQGRQVQDWRAWIVGGTSVRCAPLPDLLPETELFVGANITAVSLAWDSSMAPTVAYIDEGVLKLRWYNSLTELFQTDDYIGANSGKVATDDKRRSIEGSSDVIFAYTLDGILYWRQERDRYLVEYEVGVAGPRGDQVLQRIGMTAINRFQFELVDPE